MATTLTVNDTLVLTEIALNLISDVLLKEPNLYIHPTFPVSVLQTVTQLLQINLIDVEEGDINECVKNAMTCWYTTYAPARSQAYDLNNRLYVNNRTYIKKQIEHLQSIPQPEQRTPAWYDFRHRYLTASNIWKAFHTECSRNQLIYDKCKPINIEKYNSVCTESPMHWGQKYEAVSVLLYEDLYKTKVSDFGCLPHKDPALYFLAASPDGINTLEGSDRYGRMVEVKNIVNRDIDGIPKMEYWIQMQLQMEVCDLPLCDFLETRFKEYASFEEFIADGAYSLTEDGRVKGVLMYFIKEGKPFYVCKPLHISDAAGFTIWEEEMMQLYQDLSWMTNIYWHLDQLSCVLVERNYFWFQHAVPTLQELWQTIEKERVNGCAHRAPTKRVIKVSAAATAAATATMETNEEVVSSGYLGMEMME